MLQFVLFSTFLLCACLLGTHPHPNAPGETDYEVMDKQHAVSQDERVRFLILHYTAADDEKSLQLLGHAQVSSHYLIPADPVGTGDPEKSSVYRLVAEDKRAWHAGVSHWHGRTNLNDMSLGIEIVYPGYQNGADGLRVWPSYSESQIQVLEKLAAQLIRRYRIEPQDVLGHSDIAPFRKSDPGPEFPWQRLAMHGIGAWPDAGDVQRYLAGRSRFSPGDVSVIQRTLKAYGYDDMPLSGLLDEETRQVIQAFQMHFRPSLFDGEADLETEAIAHALLSRYRPQ